MSRDLVLVGAIVGAFGVRGEVRVKPFTAEPEGVVAYGPLYDARGRIVLTPESWRPIKGGLAIIALEVETREGAEALRNTPLHVPRERLPQPEDDEFYYVDLIGCRVEDEAGASLGEVIAVHDFGAGEVLEIKRADAQLLLLPFSKDTTPLVDVKGKRIVTRPLPEEPDSRG